MTEIKGKTYTIIHNPDSASISLEGSLRLGGMAEYQPILDLLNELLESQSTVITLNLQKLEFLNSSGISMLSKFIINARKYKETQVIIQASLNIPWQGKSLKNLQRLLPTLQLKLS
jgi:hypothetical protein